MPRDNDKNNDSRGRRDRPSGGKGRSGAARGPDKKFAKRAFAGKSDDGGRRPDPGKPTPANVKARRRAAMVTLRVLHVLTGMIVVVRNARTPRAAMPLVGIAR